MGKVLKSGVTIKGTKDGLLFYLDDTRPFSEVLQELRYKLTNSGNSQIWDGPDMSIKIMLGERQISKQEEIGLRDIFSLRNNLKIHSFETDNGKPYLLEPNVGIQMRAGTVRSGQVLTHRGDLLLLGDVNPGGCVEATGSIYVLGSLRGLAHAGVGGDETAIVAASAFRPTQLRIGDIISRPPDEWRELEIGMRFAYVVQKQIAVEKIAHLSQIRPDRAWKDSLRFGGV